MSKLKGRCLISQEQINKIKNYLLEQNHRKALLVLQVVEHEQYIGDSDEDMKKDLGRFRMVI